MDQLMSGIQITDYVGEVSLYTTSFIPGGHDSSGFTVNPIRGTCNSKDGCYEDDLCILGGGHAAILGTCLKILCLCWCDGSDPIFPKKWPVPGDYPMFPWIPLFPPVLEPILVPVP